MSYQVEIFYSTPHTKFTSPLSTTLTSTFPTSQLQIIQKKVPGADFVVNFIDVQSASRRNIHTTSIHGWPDNASIAATVAALIQSCNSTVPHFRSSDQLHDNNLRPFHRNQSILNQQLLSGSGGSGSGGGSSSSSSSSSNINPHEGDLPALNTTSTKQTTKSTKNKNPRGGPTPHSAQIGGSGGGGGGSNNATLVRHASTHHNQPNFDPFLPNNNTQNTQNIQNSQWNRPNGIPYSSHPPPTTQPSSPHQTTLHPTITQQPPMLSTTLPVHVTSFPDPDLDNFDLVNEFLPEKALKQQAIRQGLGIESYLDQKDRINKQQSTMDSRRLYDSTISGVGDMSTRVVDSIEMREPIENRGNTKNVHFGNEFIQKKEPKRVRVYFENLKESGQDPIYRDFRPLQYLRLPVEHPFIMCFFSFAWLVAFVIVGFCLLYYLPTFILFAWSRFPMQVENANVEWARGESQNVVSKPIFYNYSENQNNPNIQPNIHPNIQPKYHTAFETSSIPSDYQNNTNPSSFTPLPSESLPTTTSTLSSTIHSTLQWLLSPMPQSTIPLPPFPPRHHTTLQTDNTTSPTEETYDFNPAPGDITPAMQLSGKSGGLMRSFGRAAALSLPKRVQLEQLNQVSLLRSVPQTDLEVYYYTPSDNIFNLKHLSRIYDFEKSIFENDGYKSHCLLDWSAVDQLGNVQWANGTLVVNPQTGSIIQGALDNQNFSNFASAEELFRNNSEYVDILPQVIENIKMYNELYRQGKYTNVTCAPHLSVLTPSYDGHDPALPMVQEMNIGKTFNTGNNDEVIDSDLQGSSELSSENHTFTPLQVTAVPDYFAPSSVTCFSTYCSPLGLLTPNGELIEGVKNARVARYSTISIPVIDDSGLPVYTSQLEQDIISFGPKWYDLVDSSFGAGATTALAFRSHFQLGYPVGPYDSPSQNLEEQRLDIHTYILDTFVPHVI
jgi:hypothetical protein